jgi:glycosyltransferase involved in cell wall biosynthesis
VGSSRIALITSHRNRGAFGRKAANLALGFEEIGEPFDVVYLRESADQGRMSENGLRRDFFLDVRARASVPALIRYLREARPRMTLAAPGQVGVPAVIAGRLARQPVLPWESTFVDRDMPEWPRHMKPLMRLQGLTYKRAPGVAVISDDMARWVVDQRGVDPARLHKLPNPVNTAAIQADGAAAVIDPTQSFTMTAVGRLTEQKGVDILLDALGQRRNDLPDGWRLRMVGKGTWQGEYWEKRIDRQLAELELGEHVERLGWLENPHAIVKASDAFVHAARWEPFGNVLCEALALGVPVVATDCPGGPREILDGGRYGVLVPNEDSVALGEAIVALAGDPARRDALSAAGPGRAGEFAPAATARRILEIADAISA